MSPPEMKTPRASGVFGEATEAGNVKANSAPLGAQKSADEIANRIPFLLTREAKRQAILEFLSIWRGILAGPLS